MENAMNMMQPATTAYNPLPEFFYSEHCSEDIKKLLEKSERTLEKEGVLEQIIKLGDWIDASNNNEEAASLIASDGLSCLRSMCERLNQRADDLIRLEGEGGLPATPAQELEIAELTRAVKRIDHMIGVIEGKEYF
jgi:hypothetical protein